MGEQAHPQTENLPEPDPHSQPQIETLKTQDSKPQSVPNPDSIAQVSHPQSESPHVAEASRAAATEISHNPQNPSKIPIRPQKIRKLSTDAAAADKPSTPQTTTDDPSASASSSLALTPATTATITPSTPTTTTNTSKNRRRSASQASRVVPQIIKPLSADGEIELAIRHLRAADPFLAPLIDTLRPPEFETHLLPFHALTKSILYQQLAIKAGTAIYTRFISLCGGVDSICPDTVLALSSQQLKQIGVSGRKASYLYDLANKYKSGILSDDMVVKMDDRSLFTMLSMVKGIGSWSVHMFMVLSLQRPDVLPVSDLQVRKGVQLLYGLDELPRPSQMEQLCEKWRPYRSVGAWYMWRFVEVKGAPAAGSGVLQGSVVQPLQQIEPHQDGHQHQHQHQLQFVEPVNGIGNIGYI
ncbi:DNA-3-methyladenine glycosylase 1 [Phtheirospermum japonicum]|uniref:DNA-3-methyladenine glycosylase 1 n=1 Tax=Phtheirospermum japonicum TaxID=374723 RepID=A0A830DJB7_9LAMI|nr:DNA-3-methyladenine glycosylase 1 [Phtheirospermum japonicum]